MYNFGVGARLQVQKTEDLDKERKAGLPKTTLDTELKDNAKLYDFFIHHEAKARFNILLYSLYFGLIRRKNF